VTSSLAGQVAVVTGASGGIGQAISVALSRQCVHVCVVGREAVRLGETAALVRRFSTATEFQIDLTAEENLQPLIKYLETVGRLDLLIHTAGMIRVNRMEDSGIADLDLQYATNVRAPYLLTQRLLPMLTTARGQVVFINSSAGVTAKRPEVGQYGATKHALRAIADSLREEVNPKGIRVLTVYLGRTATPMQETLYQHEGRDYHPETLLQPDDVASVVAHALMLPPTAEMTDVNIRPMCKSY